LNRPRTQGRGGSKPLPWDSCDQSTRRGLHAFSFGIVCQIKPLRKTVGPLIAGRH